MAPDRLKQRLVGAVALLLMGALAWLWLLSADSPVDPVSKSTQIPPAPAIKPFQVPAPAQPEHIEPIGSARDSAPAQPTAPAPQPSGTAAAPAPAPTPAAPADTFQLDARGLPVAWVVQVGSFSSGANAEKLQKKLQDKGYKAYTQTGAGGVVRVYVGPKLSRERAEAQRDAINKGFKLKSIVVRFPPG